MRTSSRSRFTELVRTQWAGLLALFLVIASGTAYAANTVFSSDIVDGQVKLQDLASSSVTGAKVRDGFLNDEDVGQGTFVDFAATVGTIEPDSCGSFRLQGIGAQGDHLLLTPSDADRSYGLDYSAAYTPDTEAARLFVCNQTNSTIDDNTTHFNLLVIDAQ